LTSFSSNRGGENIHPTGKLYSSYRSFFRLTCLASLFPDVENGIFPMPGVANVTVVGVPDDRMGEAICAWIIPKPGVRTSMTHSDDPNILTPDSIKSYLKDRVAHFKVPKYYKFVDSFPMTTNGKIQKIVVKEIATRDLKTVQDHLDK